MPDPLLTIGNHHAASCGDPPIVDAEADDCCIGYFENPHGEQWVFTRDRTTGKALLRGGDVGWNTELEVVEGDVARLNLAEAERLWLQACLLAAQ